MLAPLGWAAEDDVALLAMELVLGGSVRDLLAAGGPQPAHVVGRLLGQLLDALAAVHAQGVVHGDVKPSNLLLRPGARPHLLLADFGVAARAGVRSAGPTGTPAFLPPERLAGAPAHPSPGVDDRHVKVEIGRQIPERQENRRQQHRGDRRRCSPSATR